MVEKVAAKSKEIETHDLVQMTPLACIEDCIYIQ